MVGQLLLWGGGVHIDSGADARLADVVGRGPGEVPDDVGALLHQLPHPANGHGEGLRPADDTAGEERMVGKVPVLHVVISHNVHGRGHALGAVRPDFVGVAGFSVLSQRFPCPALQFLGVLVIQAVPQGAQGQKHRPGAVQRADLLRQPLRDPISVSRAGPLEDLIANGPENDAGVVSVPQRKGFYIPLPPLVEELVVAVGRFADVPAVKGFVDDEEAILVAQVQKPLGGRVVGQPQGVVAGLFVGLQHPAGLTVEVRRAQGTGDMMDAAALELYGFAVDPQAVDRVHRHGADAEAGRGTVHRGRIARGGEGGFRGVQGGGVHIPQLGALHHQPQPGGGSLARFHPNRSAALGRLPAGSCQREVHMAVEGQGAIVDHPHLHGNGGGVPVDALCFYENAPVLDAAQRPVQQLYLPVEARPRVPPAVGGLGVVHGHLQAVGLSKAHPAGQVHHKGRVAVGVEA